MTAAGVGWVLGQLLLLAAAGTGIVRVVWPGVAPNVARSTGLMVGPALFGAATAFGMYVVPGAAGVAVGWLGVLGLAAGLSWRTRLPPTELLPGWRCAAFWIAIFIVALSARQQYWIPDAMVHAPLSASLMAGVFPPRFPWTPDVPAIYHFLPELVIGALNLGLGPGLALTTEILGAFVAAGLAALLVAVAADLGASRLSMAVLLPLLLSPGLWTLVLFSDRPAALQVAIPVGMPEAGLRAALGSVYVPEIGSAATMPVEAAPPNIINPHFIWSHGLALTAALLATVRARHRLTGVVVLALLISALSAIDETVLVAVLLALAGYVAVRTALDRRNWKRQSPLAVALAAGTALTVVQGGVLSDLLLHAPGGIDVASLRSPTPGLAWLGGVRAVGGGLGTLTVGTVAILVVSAAAAHLVRSNALAVIVVMALVLFAGFALAYFPASPVDIARLEGHALNLAMIALAVSLAVGAAKLRHRAALHGGGLLLAGLVVWPTSADSVGRIAEALADGPRLYVAGSRPVEHAPSFSRRSTLDAEIAEHRPLLEAISSEVAPNERILTAGVKLVASATGRPVPLGYAAWPHYVGLPGPEYLDAVRFLEPAALKELGIDFIHVDDALLAGMSETARQRLASPSEFRLVFQTPSLSDSLYAIVADSKLPHATEPSSFRALGELASGRRVLVSSATHPLERLPIYYALRTNEQLHGRWDDPAHFRRDVRIHPPTGETVDLIALPNSLYPSSLAPGHRTPAWSGEGVRVYDVSRPVAGHAPRPPIRVEGRTLLDGKGIQITSLPGWSDSWTGTDWVILREAEPYTGIPAILEKGLRWFPGQLAPRRPGQRIEIRFDASLGQLHQRRADGAWSPVGDAAGVLPPGSYVLTLRFSANGRSVFFVPIAALAIGGEVPEDEVFALGAS